MSVIVRLPSGQLRLYCKGAVSIRGAGAQPTPWRLLCQCMAFQTATHISLMVCPELKDSPSKPLGTQVQGELDKSGQ